MRPLAITVVLGMLVGIQAQVKFELPDCDSPQVEEAALAAREHLNAQHTHGYKYELNRIEDVKVYSAVSEQVVTGENVLRICCKGLFIT